MNAQANEILLKLRVHLEAQLNPADDDSLTEAEVHFCTEGLALAKEAGYTIDIESPTPTEVIEALEAIADEESELAAPIGSFLSKWDIVEA